MKNKLSGKFIVIDGPDGCGKTAQTKLLVDWLKKQNVAVETFREPGATAIGEKIRQILLNPEHIAMTAAAEVMLYMAARVQLWQEKIKPALKENKCVVTDRWLSSTCAYQGFAGGLTIEAVTKMAEDCLEKPWPDLTIILDADSETAAKRLKKTLDRMEQKGEGYHKKVREGFLKLAEGRSDFAVIDSADDIETVHKKIINSIEKMF
ncbi:MAG: dTMP kinase [Phycisphaerae bacterium]|nr:dTMP kinase [Phycisphaerae bacterium]